MIAIASDLTAVSIRIRAPSTCLVFQRSLLRFTQSGLPIGLQISGAPFADATVLAMAHAYQQATDWHDMRPKLKLRSP